MKRGKNENPLYQRMKNIQLALENLGFDKLEIPEAPGEYPDWLKIVYKDLFLLVNTARLDPSVSSEKLVNLGLLAKRICEYLYLSAKHFSEISNVDISQLGNLDVVGMIVEKFEQERAKLNSDS